MNGAATALSLELEPTSAASVLTVVKPSFPLESSIGEATADAAAVLGQALIDFEAGGRLTSATRTLGGEVVGRVCELQLAHLGEFDFATIVRREGKRVLHQRHGAAFRQHYGVDLPEPALDTIIGWLLDIVTKVVADEQTLAD